MATHETPSARSVMLVAGEVSGDSLGGAVARALGRVDQSLRLFGMGGPEMAAAGVELVAGIEEGGIVGLSEALSGLPRTLSVYRRVTRALRARCPAALVLIDYPGMNLRVAGAAAEAGVPVVYLAPPQVWAWRPRRARLVAERVRLVLALLPFERAVWDARGVTVRYVGHPAVALAGTAPSRADARTALGFSAGDTVVALLPGSRPAEVRRLAPRFLEAAHELAAARPRIRFAVAVAAGIDARPFREGEWSRLGATVVSAATPGVLRAADLAIVASGTASLEAGLLGTPTVVCYDVSRVSEWVARRLLRIPWIGLVNLVLGRRAVPELVGRRALEGGRLAAEAVPLLDDADRRQAQTRAFAELRELMGTRSFADEAARAIHDVTLGRRASA